MQQAAFFIQLHPRLCLTVVCLFVVIILARICLRILADGLYQPRNMGDNDLLTIKDFSNDNARAE